MRRRLWLLTVVLLAACGASSHAPLTGSNDAGADAASPDAPSGDAPRSDATPVDAVVDAVPDAPPFVPNPDYALAIDQSTLPANGVSHWRVTVTGPGAFDVIVGIDRGTAGAVAPATLELANTTTPGVYVAIAAFTPCVATTADCLGTANLTLALATDPGTLIARTPISLVTPSVDVSTIVPCESGGDVMYLVGNSSLFDGTLQTGSDESWSVEATPDQIVFDVGPAEPDGDPFHAVFSLQQLLQPLAAGTFDDAANPEFAAPGVPALEVDASDEIVGALHGRFQIHDYTADPVTGDVSSVTIGFEQDFDNSGKAPSHLEGCFHYEATLPDPVAPPPLPDPTKVSVQVFANDNTNTPDVEAFAIFTDATGHVVLDTQVDANGEAAASLPAGGEVTTIQHTPDGYEILHTTRGVVTGDHVVISTRSPIGGTTDAMLASVAPPPGANGIGIVTSCGGGGWNTLTSTLPANTALIDFHSACRQPTFDMLSVATFPTPATTPQYVWQTGLSHVANGNVTVDATWAPMGTATILLANVPSGTLPLVTNLWTRVGPTLANAQVNRITSPAVGDNVVSLSYPPGAGDATVVEVFADDFFFAPDQWDVVASDASSAITIDVAAQPLPKLGAVEQTPTGVVWAETGSGTGDIRFAFWRATFAGGKKVIWNVTEPPDLNASTTLPTLPAAHAAEDPTLDPNAQLAGASASYLDYDILTGYRATAVTGDFHSHTSYGQTFNMNNSF